MTEKWYPLKRQFLEEGKTISSSQRRRSQATAVPFTPRHFDPSSPVPLHRQLYEALREAILRGRLRPGVRLPATRALAAELELSRTTVVTAMEQLLAEGYVEGRVGSGTYVATVLPDNLLRAPVRPDGAASHPSPPRTLSRRGDVLSRALAGPSRGTGPARPFRPGVPALDAFP